MKKILCLLFFVSTPIFAEKMVFLVESEAGKHVGISENSKKYRLLTKGDAWHLYPDISSDGKKVVYVKGSDAEKLSLVQKDISTGKELYLSQEGFILHPRFAKNDQMIFFSIKDGSTQKIAFIKVNDLSLGTIPRIHYLEESVNSFFPTPFQSGEALVYQRNGEKKEIVLYDMVENKKQVIGHGMSPALSKDERYIAYTSKVESNWDIYIYDRFNKTTARVTNHSGRDFSPNFDRKNNLIYTSDRIENGVFSIYKQSLSSWTNKSNDEKLLLSKSKVSFYAPKISGTSYYELTKRSEMTGEPRSSFGAITHKGKTYVIGGHQGAEHTYPPESFTGRMTVYKKGWKDLAARNHPSHGFQVVAKGKYIYAFGGFAYEENNNPKWKSLSIVERYNIKEDKWEDIGHMPRNRSSNVVVRVKNKVYLIGGWDSTPKSDGDIDGKFHDEIDVFDLKTEKWSTLTTRLPKKRRAFSAFVKNNKIYLVGGISEGGSHFSLLDDFTEFNPETSTFKELPKLPFPTFAPAAGALNESAYLFGGMFKTGKYSYEYVPHIYRYDFRKKAWGHTGRYLSEYKGFSQVVKREGCLGILGGHSYQNNSDKPVDTFEMFCDMDWRKVLDDFDAF